MDIEPTLSRPISNRGGMTWATNSLQEMNVEQLQYLYKRHNRKLFVLLPASYRVHWIEAAQCWLLK